MGAKRTQWIVIALALLIGAWMTHSMFSLAQVECSLCVQFNAQRQCSTAYGPDQASATEEAHRNACALIARGVTETVSCGRTPAEGLQCTAR